MSSESSTAALPTDAADYVELLRRRELEVAREIAHAFLSASGPLEVYRLALARVTPLVGASFGSVFLRDEADATLLKLACAQNWPQSSARFLGQLRIRVGRGPTGRAVADAEPIDVEDIFADPALREWWEPAREIGFGSLVSLPLRVQEETLGALSFYFEGPHRFEAEERRLLLLTADQLAATAERAQLIENLRRANQQLQRQNRVLAEQVREAEDARRVKTEFLANMSHELRTPLTSILGNAELLKLQGSLAETGLQAVHKIERAGQALLGLITDLLELSQLKLGRVPLEVAPEDGRQLAELAIARAQPAAGDPAVRLEPDAGGFPLETDGPKVVRVLENLISNALKFAPGGEVRVRVRSVPRADRPPAVEWQVHDSGIGIRSEDLATIFDEFHQVDGSSTRLYGGTGLGLALSARLARLLGGEVRVESEPGAGSTFTLSLPVTAAADAAAS